MAYASGRSISSSDTISRSTRANRVSSRSDLFPRLVAMQKLADAQNFAVYRMSGSGLPAKQRLICELENWGSANASLHKAFVDAYGDALIEHVEKSLLPLAWAGSHDRSFPGAIGMAPFVVRLPDGLVPFSGLAFPVRLGAIGNGFVVFTGDDLDPPNDMVVDLHGRACQVMIDLLSLDERRVAAAEALSEREIACLQLAGDGRISEEIADKLGLSVHTVNAYLGSATIKLDSVNRIQAIAKAIRLGYIS
ncbi:MULTISPECIES: transcriptional regulator VisR [unclassified Rhizobium]|uniref:transcriptional regulator VisR n=1 Tax=unclassified Rhizobium TaxID=2613769 RepID=UPI001ADCEA82|nr:MULTISPECIES: helix-turn-helix transcriptional regulator [unclassified Rhizobium]MBO9122676.1 helix-turn-helix transcriptional regulator [Rhizobium sp. 16-488-2b]MBO9173208.1 helix-turn-helix transcriptional regulator [Rhizobium sp. 16-488-2a]